LLQRNKKHTGDAHNAALYPTKTKHEQSISETGTTQARHNNKKRDKKHKITGHFTGYLPHFYQQFKFFSFSCNL
jgi:hypothetical protein